MSRTLEGFFGFLEIVAERSFLVRTSACFFPALPGVACEGRTRGNVYDHRIRGEGAAFVTYIGDRESLRRFGSGVGCAAVEGGGLLLGLDDLVAGLCPVTSVTCM